MIPKIIHYCWFGRNSLPESAIKCINSWKKFLPDYEIWQWSEEPLHANANVDVDNLFDKVLAFDVNIIPYTQQAYEAKKYAFVSDYARFWILYQYGGLYFDTDVEVIKPLDDILELGSFMGVEIPSKDGSMPQVNPGLGLGAEPAMKIYKEALDNYAQLSFLNADGTHNLKTIVSYNTELLTENGLRPTNEIQQVLGIWIYPDDYFNPLDDLTGKLRITDNSRSIHWYNNSWSNSSSMRRWLSRLSHRVFGLRLHQLKEFLHKTH